MTLLSLNNGKTNNSVISDITKTLTAMANTSPDKEGVIIIGVANNKSAAIQHKDHYKSNWIETNKCYVAGINGELNKYWDNSTDNYVNHIKQIIFKEPIQDDVKSQITRDFEVIEYHGKTLIILKCKNNGHAFTYNQEFYERHGSNTEKVIIGSPAFNDLVARTTVK